MARQQTFWIDESFDREHAADGELNELLDPIVDQLETDIPADS